MTKMPLIKQKELNIEYAYHCYLNKAIATTVDWFGPLKEIIDRTV